MSNRVFDLEKTHPKTSKKIWQKRVSNRIPPKSNQVINLTREIWLLSFVWIGWMVLTLSCRQADFCLSMSQPLPWVKVTKRSSNTFSQTYTILSLSQISKVLLKRFWREKQKSLRRRQRRRRTRTRRRKRTENIKWLNDWKKLNQA